MSEPYWALRRRPQSAADAVLLGRWRPTRAANGTVSRRQLVAALEVGGAAGVTGGAVERLLLAFEELVSNAVRHGRPPVQASVTETDHFWLLEVTDAAGNQPPTPDVDRDAALGGLGLGLVAAIADAVGWEPTPTGGKLVWARLDFTRDEEPRPAPPPRPGDAVRARSPRNGSEVAAPPHQPAPVRSAASTGAGPEQVPAHAVPTTTTAALGSDVLAAALEALPDGVALFDADWAIGYVNPAGAAVLGRPADELPCANRLPETEPTRTRGKPDVARGDTPQSIASISPCNRP